MATVDKLRPGLHQTSPLDEKPDKRRPAWRRRLIDTERGFITGLRSDSTLFIHLFGITITLVAGFVLGLSLTQWTAVVLALTVVFTTEMFNLILRRIWKTIGHHFGEEGQRILAIGTAGVSVAMLGAVVTMTLVFGERISQLFAG